MLRYKILNCVSNARDEDQRICSKVEIGTELGKFTGVAYLRDEDDFSNFLGCSVAESKAYRKYLKRKIANTRERINELENLIKILLCCKGYNPYSLEARKIRRRCYELKDELQKYKDLYRTCSVTTESNLAKRDKVIRDLKLQHQLASKKK